VAPPTQSDSTPATTTAATNITTIADPEGWEEPTTGQAPPTWDEELQVSNIADSRPVENGEEAGEGEGDVEAEEQEITTKEPVLDVQSKEPEPEAQPQQQAAKLTRPAAVSHRSSAAARYKNVDSPVVMPSTIFGGAGKGVGASGGALGFGGVGVGGGGAGVGALGGLGVEKVGMQFGSLSLGGDSLDANA
jgi:hypothetical protein